MTAARLRAPIAMIAALFLLLLTALVAVPNASATGGGSSSGATVCPGDGGWRKIDGLNGTSVTVAASEARLITEVCVKAGTEVRRVTVDPPVKSYLVQSPATNGHGATQDISHVSVREIPDSGGWFYPAPTCEGSLVVTYPGGVSGNDVNVRVRDLVTDESRTFNFHRNDGSWDGTRTFDPTAHRDWPGWTYYTYEWVQVDGTNYHWEGDVVCGGTPEPVEIVPSVHVEPAVCVATPGVVHGQELVPGAVSVEGAEGAQVSVRGADGTQVPSAAALSPGAYRVVVVRDDGQEFGDLAAGWEVDGDTATYAFTIEPAADCWEAVEVEMTGEPTVVDLCGTADDDVSFGTAVGGTWKLGSRTALGDGTTRWRVVLTPDAGYALPAQGSWDKVVEGKAVWLLTTDDRACVTALAPTVDLQCGATPEDAVTFPEIDGVTYEMWQSPNGLYTVKASVDASTHVLTNGSAADASVKWFKLDLTLDEDDCLPEPTVVTPEAPEHEDQCGPGNLTVTFPTVTGVEYSSEQVGDTVVVHAVPTDGHVLADAEGQAPQGWTWTFTDSDEACPVPAEPSLTGSTAVGECVADAPWIFYEVRLEDADDVVAETTVRLRIDGVDGENVELVLGDLEADGTLSGKVLWPGASVGEDGETATGWPGWIQLADGSWSQTNGNHAWTRGDVTATLVVNPELEVDLTYPDATPECASPQVTEVDEPAGPTGTTPDGVTGADGEPGVDGARPSETVVDAAQTVETGSGALPQTGSNVLPLVLGALALVAAGGVAIFVVRRRA
ncbi:LPXTG cell wall anchor domain-containing protein [Isoptericola jiangsuensis]|uniref:LPXTG cell wall anchor domain-containing protein n=1 Tax=Isoptericola jiangsuensis TaxID=548579 RepID=UPI003AAC87E3